MTTASGLRAGHRNGAVRCVWSVVVALFAVLAVLVHHDTTPAAMPAGTMSAMAGMDHTASASAGHGSAQQVTYPDMGDDSGACSGAGAQHCSSGDVGTATFVVPPTAVLIDRWDAASSVSVRRGLPGTAHRAPPDLSALSRLLI
ncbi:DUF6153 family protein [Streptomyces sp. NPDC001982]|uniref:DUF6153 family protein n=1 Tax=Streptomyces sp. NPDC001982 TaxID=3154405 RepID=UPI00332167BF